MKSITGCSIILTENCNLKCSYCYEKDKHSQIMTKETLIEGLNFLFKNNNKQNVSIVWFGGEPLLNFEALKVGVEYIKTLNLPFSVSQLLITNGTILNDEIEEFLRQNPNINIQLSWDGMPKFQNTERGMSETFEINLVKFLNLPNQIHAHLQITPNMCGELIDNIKYVANKMGNKFRVVLRPITDVEGWTEEVSEIFVQQLSEVYKLFGDKIDKIANCESAVSSTGLCGAGKTFASITPTGDIYACHRFYFNGDKDFKIGTVSEGFTQNTKSKLLEGYDVSNIFGCDECEARELCDRCIASNQGQTGSFLIPSDTNCNVGKNSFQALINYIAATKPWLLNYEPTHVSLPVAFPENMDAKEIIVNYYNPILMELLSTIDLLQDKVYKLEKRVEYNERK